MFRRMMDGLRRTLIVIDQNPETRILVGGTAAGAYTYHRMLRSGESDSAALTIVPVTAAIVGGTAGYIYYIIAPLWLFYYLNCVIEAKRVAEAARLREAQKRKKGWFI